MCYRLWEYDKQKQTARWPTTLQCRKISRLAYVCFNLFCWKSARVSCSFAVTAIFYSVIPDKHKYNSELPEKPMSCSKFQVQNPGRTGHFWIHQANMAAQWWPILKKKKNKAKRWKMGKISDLSNVFQKHPKLALKHIVFCSLEKKCWFISVY